MTDSMMNTYRRWPVEFVRGRGATLVDSEGREYIDFVAGIAVASVGHSHPAIVAAISEQAARLMHVSNLYKTRPQAELAERLRTLTDMRSFFCNSGAEAIECALKLARRWAGRHKGTATPKIVCTDGGFHGRTLGALAATGQPAKQHAFAPMLPGFAHVPYGDVSALRKAMSFDVVAVLLEPVQGEAGVVVPPPAYISEARALCDEFGALLILDEVQTGLGRTGRWFGHEHFDVRPDVMCLAKALGGGLPIGACLATDEVASAFVPGDHASTFGGGPVQCAAALAVMDVIEKEDLLDRAEVVGEHMRDRLASLFGDEADVRGLGLLIGAEFADARARGLVGAALERGLLVNDATPNVLRVVPPLVIGDEEAERGLDILEEVWDAARRED